MEKTIDRIALADSWHKKGYNCAQAVFLAFQDLTGVEEETAVKVASSFGGGLGYAGEVCGAVSGMAMTLGMLYGFSDPSAKPAWYKEIKRLVLQYKEEHGGMVRCGEFLANKGAYPCIDLIHDAVRMTEAYIVDHS